MWCSLNEVETEARKAARGAGLAWGLAEETGNAARFLAAHQLDSVPLLIHLLDRHDGRPYAAIAPMSEEGRVWRARGGSLCPIVAGSALQDHASDSMVASPLNLRHVQSPALLVPFVAASAGKLRSALALEWPGVRVCCFADRFAYQAERADLLCTSAAAVRLSRSSARPNQGCGRTATTGLSVDDAAWARLSIYVARTYVPTSTSSRLYGAGAGLLDND
jgi:hypothetical protein